MPDIKDFVLKRLVPDEVMVQPWAEDFVKQETEEMEKEAIYQAVKQTDGWMSIKSETAMLTGPWKTREISVMVHCRPISTYQVFIPVFDRAQLPPGTYKCQYCGGYTRNDKRGNCGACGAPRDDNYLEDFNA